MDKQQFECFTLSPLDGRYAGIKDALGEYFSEYALVKYRVFVEIQWLKFLIENVESDVLSKFNKDNLGQIEAISKNFNYDSFKAIKDIEAITSIYSIYNRGNIFIPTNSRRVYYHC